MDGGPARLYRDAREDASAAFYSLLVAAPASLVAARWLVRRGKLTTPSQVLLVSFIVPAILIGVPLWFQWSLGPPNLYSMLQIRRGEPSSEWAHQYIALRNMYQRGEMPASVWRQLDTAYEHLFDERARRVYDFWGDGAGAMTILQIICNIGLFYLLWIGIIHEILVIGCSVSLTTSNAAARASKWALTGLAAILALELSVKLLYFDPVRGLSLFPFATPHDAVVWAHRVFPILVLTIISIKRVFYVDLDAHQQKILRYLATKHQEIQSKIQDMAAELQGPQAPESSANADAVEDAKQA